MHYIQTEVYFVVFVCITIFTIRKFTTGSARYGRLGHCKRYYIILLLLFITGDGTRANIHGGPVFSLSDAANDDHRLSLLLLRYGNYILGLVALFITRVSFFCYDYFSLFLSAL